MLSKDTLKLIEDNTKQITEPLGFDLVELKYMQASGNIILRFLIDRAEGGISLGECSDLNRRISQLLEEKNIISERYILEVSSPGIDRLLIEPKDFRRVVDKKIHIFFKKEYQGKMEAEGRLVRLDNQGIGLVSNDDKEEYIPFLEINRAKQVIS